MEKTGYETALYTEEESVLLENKIIRKASYINAHF